MQTLQEYKCPCCGGAITFDSSLQKMKCPYCDTEFEMETLAGFDEQLRSEQTDQMQWDTDSGEQWQETENVCSYVCRSCGGEIVGEATTTATTCPFCGNAVVMMDRLRGTRRPDLVLPFQLDREAAKKAFASHLSGKRLLPKLFREESRIESIRGMYVPFWLFDTQADAAMRYRATRVRVWSDRDFNYTETQHYSVFREGSISFSGIPVDGSAKMDDALMETLEPFDLSQAVDFQTAYLAGYIADQYDVDARQSESRANERVKRSTQDSFSQTVRGYATVTPESSSIRLHNGRVRYALLPVWIMNTTWNGERYIFAMNGQTGKFAGNLPVDRTAAARWTMLLTLGFGAAAYGAIWLLHLMGLL